MQLIQCLLTAGWFFMSYCDAHTPDSSSPISSKTINPELIPFNFRKRGDVAALPHLVKRLLGARAAEHFEFEIIDDCPLPYNGTNLCFVLENAKNDRTKVMGTSVSEISYGLSHYLRFFCGMDISWERTGGSQLDLPETWPKLNERVVKVRSSPVSYFNNVVTFSYSFAWYSWEDWEKYLDWGALFGYNLMIAYTGQEEIYRRTFKSFGVTEDEFAEWCNGPAYLAWARGQNLHGMSGPLPREWMTDQFNLQIKILQRMRELGMVPVLPTFQGNLPPQFRKLFPNANITKKGTAWLDGTDPLFATIQKRYMAELVSSWGTDHWYETDGYFDQKDGPWYQRHDGEESLGHMWKRASDVPIDPAAARRSKLVYESMSRIDPDAIWLYQGWIWRGFGEDKLPYMKGWISGVPKGRFVMLDMWDEVSAQWSQFGGFSYFGTPYIWSVLHNFGGNTGMWGSLQTLNTEPFKAFELSKSSVVGVGAAPEGIDQNPVYYSFLSDVNWFSKPVCLRSYLNSYVVRRYGLTVSTGSTHLRATDVVRGTRKLQEAWALLLDSVYSESSNRKRIHDIGGFIAEKNLDGITAVPLPAEYLKTPETAWFNLTAVESAWEAMVTACELLPEALCTRSTFVYDLVNVGREVLAQHSNELYSKLVHAKSKDDVQRFGSALLQLMSDCDKLLCSSPSLSTDTWLSMANRLAKGNRELSAFYEVNARSQTTTWGPQAKGQSLGSMNLDYANKQWGGQVGGFYSLRLKCYIDQAFQDFSHGKDKVNVAEASLCAGKVSYDWTHDVGAVRFPICVDRTKNTLQLSKVLLQKYRNTYKKLTGFNSGETTTMRV